MRKTLLLSSALIIGLGTAVAATMPAAIKCPNLPITLTPSVTTASNRIAPKDDAQPAALYQRPEGTMFFGYTPDYNLMQVDNRGVMIAAPCTPLTWVNTSNAASQSFEWEYVTYGDWGLPQINHSTERDLTIDYPADYMATIDWWMVPKLTASAPGGQDSTYTWPGLAMQVGGRPQYTFDGDTEPTYFPAGLYDLTVDKFFALKDNNGNYLAGYSTGTDQAWNTLLSQSGSKLQGLLSYFPAVPQPYTVSRVYVHGVGTFVEGSTTEFKAHIIKFDDQGRPADTIASGTARVADIVSVDAPEGERYHTIPFVLKNEDGLEDIFVIDEPVAVVVEGFNADNTQQFGVFQTTSSATQESNSYYIMRNSAGRTSIVPSEVISLGDDPLYSTFLIDMDVNFPWFDFVDDDITYADERKTEVNYNAAPQGETRVFKVEASQGTDSWGIAYDTPDGMAPAWLTVTGQDTPDSFDRRAGRGTLTAQIAALEAGAPARQATIIIDNEGITHRININQSNPSAVTTVTTANGLQARFNGDILEVNTTDAFQVYNTAGQLMATTRGNATIDATSWPAGIYLVRTATGHTAKVAK